MKTNLVPLLIWSMLLLCMSCSSENDTYDTVIEPEPQGENPPVENPVPVPPPPQGGENPPVDNPPVDNAPVAPSPPEGAVEIPGFPKSIDNYYDGSHTFSTQYYYRSDGKLIQISHRYPHYSSGIYTNTFSYDSVGKLIKIEGIDVYDFLWEGERIVRADKNNLPWFGRSEIFYEYNASGQIIQTTENFLETTPPSTAKNLYHYYEDGNPRSVESYFRENVEGKDFELYYTTTFEGYTSSDNLFLEFVIIPGQLAQRYFPLRSISNDLRSGGGGYSEFDFSYTYDSEGRVIEKVFGLNKVVYQYYQ